MGRRVVWHSIIVRSLLKVNKKTQFPRCLYWVNSTGVVRRQWPARRDWIDNDEMSDSLRFIDE